MKLRYLVGIFFLLIIGFQACSKKNPALTRNNLVAIFANYEIANASQKSKIIEQYQLDNSVQRQLYYNKIQEIMSDQKDFEAFLSEVEEYKKNNIASVA